MNRRGFLSAMIQAGVGAMVLPGAVTYARTWKRGNNDIWVVNPAWINAPYELDPLFYGACYGGKWPINRTTLNLLKPGNLSGLGNSMRYRFDHDLGTFTNVPESVRFSDLILSSKSEERNGFSG